MLSILCVRLTIKVKAGIPESFKVGWYPSQKTGSSHLKVFVLALYKVPSLAWVPLPGIADDRCIIMCKESIPLEIIQRREITKKKRPCALFFIAFRTRNIRCCFCFFTCTLPYRSLVRNFQGNILYINFVNYHTSSTRSVIQGSMSSSLKNQDEHLSKMDKSVGLAAF